MVLIFVYNANSGTINSLIDSAHKWVSPKTYNCKLCALTFGILKEEKTWRAFRNSSEIKMDFYHKDEFEVAFGANRFNYPVVLKLKDDTLESLIDTNTLSTIESSKDLIKQIEIKLRQASA